MHFKKMHLVNAYIAYFYHFVQGRIQGFLRGGSNLQRGFDLLNLPDTGNLLFFTDFSENSQCLSEPPLVANTESRNQWEQQQTRTHSRWGSIANPHAKVFDPPSTPSPTLWA